MEENQEVFGIIYKITNLINGKIYIGQTTRGLEKRFREHKQYSKNKSTKNVCILHKSMTKYGVENFIIEQIDSGKSLEELNEKEHNHIVNLNSLAPNGYNLSTVGVVSIFSKELIDRMKKSFRKVGSIGAIDYKWVSKIKNKYQSQLYDGEKFVNFGFFDSPDIAAWFYDNGVRFYRNGEGYLNFPMEIPEDVKVQIKELAERNLNKTIGIHFRKPTKKWSASIWHNKLVTIGSFNTKIEAMCAYDGYIIKHNLNKQLNINMAPLSIWQRKSVNGKE